MNGFTVWYVLSVLTVNANTHRLENGLYIHPDLPSCQKAATRVLAVDPDSKWRCHEMSVEVKNGKVFVEFTGEGSP